eukprot:586930-Rhodomonas_salina.2
MWSIDLSYRMYDSSAASIVEIQPGSIPTSPRIKKKQVDLKSRVSIFVVDFPMGLTVASGTILVTVGGEIAELLAINYDTATPSSARIDILAPSFKSPGVKDVAVINLLSFVTIGGTLVYGPMFCNLDKYCRSRNLVADLQALADTPSRGCENKFCTSKRKLTDISFESVSPNEGPTLGGTEVKILFTNIPAERIEDISVTAGRKARKEIAEVVAIEYDADATLLANTGTLTIRMPSSRKAGEKRFRLRVKFDGKEFKRDFFFDYLPLVKGQAAIVEFSPAVQYVSSDLDLFAEIRNIGKFKKRRDRVNNIIAYDTSAVQYSITDMDGRVLTGGVEEIIDSDKIATKVSLSLPGPWPLGDLTVKFWADKWGESLAGTMLIPVHADPTPMVSSTYPVYGKLDVDTTMVLKVKYLPVNTTDDDITGLLTLGNATAITVTGLVAVHDAGCILTVCTLFDLTVTLPAVTTAGDAVIDLTVSFEGTVYNTSTTFTYISASLELFQPRTQTTDEAGASDISVYLSNFPTQGCGITASCAASIGTNTVVVSFGNEGDGTIDTSSLLDIHGFLFFKVKAPTTTVGEAVSVGIGLYDSSNDLILDVGSDITFTYQNLNTELSPVDGTSLGGTVFTLTVYGWGSNVLSATSPDLLSIYFNGDSDTGVEGDVLTIESTGTEFSPDGVPPRSSLTIQARTPAMSVVGRLSCLLSLSLDDGVTIEDSTTFAFEIYEQPTGIASPSTATPVGVTTADDLMSTTVTIDNFPSFPTVLSAGDVEVTFARATGVVASVTAIERLGSQVVVTVIVPAATG